MTVPTYDRTSLGRGIVHIGVGGFHRAHQAAYLDDLCQNGLTDWSITGAGVLPGDAAMADALEQQDNLYTLITRDRESTTPRVIGSIVDYVLATPAITPLIDVLADPSTRVVSLTITEGGYPV
ncbi:MAG: mannitol dehydrogenase family protein, partial [Acidobacteriota bacterium]